VGRSIEIAVYWLRIVNNASSHQAEASLAIFLSSCESI